MDSHTQIINVGRIFGAWSADAETVDNQEACSQFQRGGCSGFQQKNIAEENFLLVLFLARDMFRAQIPKALEEDLHAEGRRNSIRRI